MSKLRKDERLRRLYMSYIEIGRVWSRLRQAESRLSIVRLPSCRPIAECWLWARIPTTRTPRFFLW